MVSPPSPFPLLPSPPKPSPLPIRRLSLEELANHRERGLCFYCDEKYNRGHRCASHFFLLVADEDPDDDPLNPNISPPLSPNPPRPDNSNNPTPTHSQPDPPQAQISLHALLGHTAPETLRMTGRISQQPVVILIDGGSTHNFVHACLVKSLGLNPQPTPTLRVLVGNGNEVVCSQICLAVTIHLQGHSFTVDLHVLPLCGADIVMGVQWLKSLGPVLTDYNDLTMKFLHQGQLIELKGTTDMHLLAVSPPQLRCMLQTQSVSEFFHIRVCPPTSPSPTTHPEILSILDQFAPLFQPPTTLPPSRSTNHFIHLLPNSSPVNTRPYRYPHFQKQEIESQVSAMLSNGIIRPSRSPFSSPSSL